VTAPLAFITGGQQGIGLGIAQALAAEGFRIAIAADAPHDAPAVQAALSMLGPDVRYFRHDLSDLAAIPALLDTICDELGPIDAFVQNAGVAPRARGDMLEMTPENLAWILGVNLTGAFFLAQAVAKRMLTSASAHYRSVTFVTSVSARMASPERADYCISKAAASMAAQTLALRLALHGIGVFELRPGIIETAMTAGVRDAYSARIRDGLVPAGRWGQPSDIGQAIIPYVTGKMSFSTGAVIPVDGGLSIEKL
jgi:NAD(P)-dependent dehydrogenase (short-subunit alcohol dehydrogenase family)